MAIIDSAEAVAMDTDTSKKTTTMHVGDYHKMEKCVSMDTVAMDSKPHYTAVEIKQKTCSPRAEQSIV